MATYESIFIFNPKTEDETEEKIVNDIRSLLDKSKCNIKLDLKWGKRPLGYIIKKETEGIYHYFAWEGGEGNVVDILQNKVKVTDSLLRAFHVRIDDELKPLKKRYLSGKETNIAGVIRGDGKDKDSIEDLELIYHEPTAVYLRDEY